MKVLMRLVHKHVGHFIRMIQYLFLHYCMYPRCIAMLVGTYTHTQINTGPQDILSIIYEVHKNVIFVFERMKDKLKEQCENVHIICK